MAYTITYKFGQALDVGESVGGGHLIRMQMDFIVEDTGVDEEHFAGDYGIRIIDWGELEWKRELDENLMVPGNFKYSVFDGSGYLTALLFEGVLVTYVRKDVKVTLEIKYSGDANYSTEYVGYVSSTDILWDKVSKVIDFSAYPKTDLLKTYYLYDEATDGSGRKIGKNPLSLTYSVSGDVYSADPVNVKTLIHEILKKVNSSATLSWQHNWTFDSNTPVVLKDLEDLTFNSNYLSALFFSIDNLYQIENLYDLLMGYAFAFGFICGFITNDKAFVKDLFYYDATNLQTLGTVKSHKVSNMYGDVEAVRITSRLLARDTRVGKNAYSARIQRYGIVPSGSTLLGENIIDKEIPVFCYRTSGVDYGDMTFIDSGTEYTAGHARVPLITGGNDLHSVVANFYYNLRNRNKVVYAGGVTSTIGRVDQLLVSGIQYDYMKDFSYDSKGYQILTLRKQLTKNQSYIEALPVTSVMDDNTPDTGDAPPKPFENVLPGGYLRDYSYNGEILPADIEASTTVDLFVIPAGFELKKIIIKINTAFNAITSMKIVDNDGDLITTDRINNEDNEVVESFQYKNYAAQKTIQAVFTKSGTCNAGEADIILELRTRL